MPMANLYAKDCTWWLSVTAIGTGWLLERPEKIKLAHEKRFLIQMGEDPVDQEEEEMWGDGDDDGVREFNAFDWR